MQPLRKGDLIQMYPHEPPDLFPRIPASTPTEQFESAARRRHGNSVYVFKSYVYVHGTYFARPRHPNANVAVMCSKRRPGVPASQLSSSSAGIPTKRDSARS